MSPSRSAAGTRTRRGFTRRGSATSTDGATPATEGTGTHEVGLGPRSSARTDHPADGPPSDAPLWAEAQRGSTAAFAELFDRHADAVYRYTVVRLHQPQAAEEVVSVVFAEAWRQRHRIELLDGSLRPWLFGVARNQASRTTRQHVRQLRRDQLLVAGAVPDHAAAVADGIDAARDLGRVLDAIDELPDEGREPLVLHVWGELSHEQIARELGVSVGTVKSRIHRARRRLATALDAPDEPSAPANARPANGTPTSVAGSGGR